MTWVGSTGGICSGDGIHNVQLIVLVDYDNVKPIRRDRTAADANYNVELIVDAISQTRAQSFSQFKDVRVRFYGGWTDVSGRLLEAAAWVERAASQVRGRRLGGRIIAELALGLFDSEYGPLRGLYRDGGQKMVDTLIVSDAVRITLAYEAKVLVASDDEDMLPGLLACHLHMPKAVIRRSSTEDHWHNKNLVSNCGVITEWGVYEPS